MSVMLNPATRGWRRDGTAPATGRATARRLMREFRFCALAAGWIVLWVAATARADAGHDPAINQETAPPAGDERSAEPQSLPPWERFLDILAEHHIPYDPDTLEVAALRAMLHAVDRHAKILSAEAAQALRRRKMGIRDSVSWTVNDDAVDETAWEPMVPVSVEIWPHDIVYVKISGLYPRAGTLFSEALTDALPAQPTGLIIDLRQAGGQDFDAVDRMAAFFVEGGAPLYEIRTLAGQTLRQGVAEDGIPRWEAPAMVLTGHQTVQAAELLAAILRGTRGVMLLGNRTRGDPKLRELYPWSGNQYLYLPTAVIRPAHHDDYTLVGVVPHVFVDGTRRGLPQTIDSAAESEAHDDTSPLRKMPDAVIRDPTLTRAVDILTGLKAIEQRDGSAPSGDVEP